METIYLDSLFLINLAANYFILMASARICGVALRRRRLAAGAALGALYAVLTLLPGLGFLSNRFVKLAAAGFMLLAAFGSERSLGRLAVVFLAVSAALGGALYAVSMLGGYPAPNASFAGIQPRTLILGFAVSYAAVSIAFRYSGDKSSRRLHRVVLSFEGRNVTLTALRDTGNSLREPYSGRAVAIAELESLLPLFDADSSRILSECAGAPYDCLRRLAESRSGRSRFYLVPYSAVGVEHGILLAFRPDTVCDEDRGEVYDIVVAISVTRLSDKREFTAIF